MAADYGARIAERKGGLENDFAQRAKGHRPCCSGFSACIFDVGLARAVFERKPTALLPSRRREGLGVGSNVAMAHPAATNEQSS
ncbi:hypothetical protein CVO77_13315 [Sphingopyxis lindanitolerans]|uniref:Uncharacterized protein n=1 Tax=Sphingopyxis lindanitolerans TaxID=2054227 RepID=A0A2S8B137_9SPHN|nr:hypothetical protein CVO77_13315 [Sphingopyxis lindanitolerans]